MAGEPTTEIVEAVVRQVNQAWLNGRFDELEPLLHQDVIVV